jgi:prolyl-tRNA synthetase
MFADWELIGVPFRITVGERSLKEGFVELQARTQTSATQVKLAEVLGQIKEALLQAKQS